MGDKQIIAAFPIRHLWVCVDCDVAVNHPVCPYCLSRNLNPLAAWLNRPTTTPAIEFTMVRDQLQVRIGVNREE